MKALGVLANSPAMRHWQRTLRKLLRFEGVGLHTGEQVSICVIPAPANSGIVFRQNGSERSTIPALIANVSASNSQLCTKLTANGWSVSTPEHLMAALVASRITNAFVDFENNQSPYSKSEVPVLDGSSVKFMKGIQHVGIEEQEGAELKYLCVKRPVHVFKQDKNACFLPTPNNGRAPTLHMSVQVNFEHKRLDAKLCRFTLGPDPTLTMDAFNRDIAPARTFTFEEEIKWLHANGLALGGSLDNAVVFSKKQQADAKPIVLNLEGLRFPDEWTRHKMLDCIGDIGLAGLPLHGYFYASRPGHALTHELLRELYKDPENYAEMP
uniref:UDP-3-O-acyl-N-acetylglucosamine deacetylase n=1 Tax=Peronospora matthiolae TaxID=2874970 RepID=A0AAV1T911_9STRA